MPQEFVRRDVELVQDQATTLMKSIDTLRKLEPTPEVARWLSLAYTYAEVAGFYVKAAAFVTNERQG